MLHRHVYSAGRASLSLAGALQLQNLCNGSDVNLGFHHRHLSSFRQGAAVEHHEARARSEERVVLAHTDPFPRVELRAPLPNNYVARYHILPVCWGSAGRCGVGLGRVGLGRVGSGRVRSGRVGLCCVVSCCVVLCCVGLGYVPVRLI